MPLTDAAPTSPARAAPRARAGHGATLEAVLRDYGPSLARVARIYAPNPADREDRLQEIAVALLRALPRFCSDSHLGTVVYRIALNRAITGRARRGIAALEAIARALDEPA